MSIEVNLLETLSSVAIVTLSVPLSNVPEFVDGVLPLIDCNLTIALPFSDTPIGQTSLLVLAKVVDELSFLIPHRMIPFVVASVYVSDPMVLIIFGISVVLVLIDAIFVSSSAIVIRNVPSPLVPTFESIGVPPTFSMLQIEHHFGQQIMDKIHYRC